MVGLKRVYSSRAPHEVEISQYFSTGSLSLERQNHCVPILDVLYPPDDDTVLLVMPLLRPFDDPPFNSVGEALDFFRQLFEVRKCLFSRQSVCLTVDRASRIYIDIELRTGSLQRLNLVPVFDATQDRDCHSGNIMMDPRPLYPDMFHPIRPDMNRTLTGKAKHFTRTENPVKYYFIDFGISGRYPPGEGTPSAPVHVGGDRTVPEFLTSNNTHNPFPTDVYYVGNLVREEFLQVKVFAHIYHLGSQRLQKTRGLEFMKPLVEEMVQADPAKRPTADVVVNIFDRLLKGVSPATMRKRLARRKEVFGLFKDIRHTFQNFRFKMRHLSPMPTPPM